jgi:hypothetical protein
MNGLHPDLRDLGIGAYQGIPMAGWAVMPPNAAPAQTTPTPDGRITISPIHMVAGCLAFTAVVCALVISGVRANFEQQLQQLQRATIQQQQDSATLQAVRQVIGSQCNASAPQPVAPGPTPTLNVIEATIR